MQGKGESGPAGTQRFMSVGHLNVAIGGKIWMMVMKGVSGCLSVCLSRFFIEGVKSHSSWMGEHNTIQVGEINCPG